MLTSHKSFCASVVHMALMKAMCLDVHAYFGELRECFCGFEVYWSCVVSPHVRGTWYRLCIARQFQVSDMLIIIPAMDHIHACDALQ